MGSGTPSPERLPHRKRSLTARETLRGGRKGKRHPLLLPPREFSRLVSDLLDAGLGVRFGVRGGSMAPAILDGQSVVAQPLHGRPADVGDIVVVTSPAEGLLVHRVVRTSGGRVVTKGDASAVPDRAVRASDVRGRVTVVESSCPMTWAQPSPSPPPARVVPPGAAAPGGRGSPSSRARAHS